MVVQGHLQAAEAAVAQSILSLLRYFGRFPPGAYAMGAILLPRCGQLQA